MAPQTDMSRRGFALGLLAILSVAALLRAIFPAVDPPWNPPVGIVWHDEGAWVHNARNKALFGAWSLDAWNPVYIAPVFTGLEYVAFELFGVGVRQARLVPAIGGLVSVLLLALGVARLAGRRSGLIAGALLATNYVYVMWNRAALMEGPMVAFIVASWYCYVRAQQHARWGWAAGACALLAFFTKASAAFFVAALAADARRDARAGACRPPAPRAWCRCARPHGRPRCRRDARRARDRRARDRRCSSSCRTGPTTGSTTGRCRSRASRRIRSARSSTGRRGFRSCRTSSRGCGWRSWPRRWPPAASWRGGGPRRRPSACSCCGSWSAWPSSSCTTPATSAAT